MYSKLPGGKERGNVIIIALKEDKTLNLTYNKLHWFLDELSLSIAF
jgi:hypothetical protein